MPTTVVVDGIRYTIEALPSGNLRVSHPQPQINPMHGPDTAGLFWFEVHPCQKNQFDFWSAQLPPTERPVVPAELVRPWWSLPPGERATLKE